jgi:hypothetical protein
MATCIVALELPQWSSSVNPSLQMSPPPSGFGDRSGGGGGGPLSHFYSGSPTSYFTSGLQAGLKQSHLSKVRRLPCQGQMGRARVLGEEAPKALCPSA